MTTWKIPSMDYMEDVLKRGTKDSLNFKGDMEDNYIDNREIEFFTGRCLEYDTDLAELPHCGCSRGKRQNLI